MEPEIVRFGNVPKNGVVGILSAHFESPQGCACVFCGAVERRSEVGVGWEAGVRAGGRRAALESVMDAWISRWLPLSPWRVSRFGPWRSSAVFAGVLLKLPK